MSAKSPRRRDKPGSLEPASPSNMTTPRRMGSRQGTRFGLELTSTQDELSSALLVEAAEIENRLRKHVIELLEPTIRKQKLLEVKTHENKTLIDAQVEKFGLLQKIEEGAEALRGMVEGFRAELADWDRERREQEQKVGERLSLQEIEINAVRSSIERRATEMASASRTVKNLGDIVTDTKNEMAELRRYCSDRLDLTRDKISKLRDEFETREMALETEQHRLQDCQTFTDTNIAHMKAELARVVDDVANSVSGIEELKRSKASVKCVQEQQQEFSEFARQVNAHVSGLRQQFGSLVDDVKAHFQTAAHVVGTSTAKQMDDMRSQYQEEVRKMDSVLSEMDAFLRNQKEAETALKDDLNQVREGASRDIDTLRGQFEVNAKRRELDCSNLQVEVQQLRSKVQDTTSLVQANEHGHSVRNDIISFLVESQLLSASLDWQDNIDWKSVALFGYKTSENAKGCTLPNIDAGGGGRPGKSTPRKTQSWSIAPAAGMGGTAAAGVGSPENVMTIDKRCLSCSGSAATVLAGFKLACLEYTPSPVEYQKVMYSRSELIQMRIELLKQAKQQMTAIE